MSGMRPIDHTILGLLTKKGRQNNKEFWFGKPDELKKIPTGTKEQKKLHKHVLQNALGMGQEGYNQANNYYGDILNQSGEEGLQEFLSPYQNKEAFEQFSKPYMTQFEEQILPQLLERFAGMGGANSSGLAQTLGGAASGLQAQLAQLFSNLIGNYQTNRQNSQQNAASSLTNQFNNLTTTGLNYQPFAYNKQKGNSGALPGLLTGLGTVYGGPGGAQFGNQTGQQISQMFQ